MTEPLPSNILTNLLKDNWNAGNVKKPSIIEINAPFDATLRVDLTRSDFILIRSDPSGFVFTMRNAYNYRDVRITMTAEIHTKKDRQRLYDMMAEVRRICEVNTHNVTGFHVIRFMGFSEFTTEELNVWKGSFRISMESAGIRTAYTVP